MLRRSWLPLCAFTALSSIPLAADERTPGLPASSPDANERGAPALFAWGDVDGDGRLDLAVVDERGKLQLLVHAGAGRFEDVTERAGLASTGEVALVLWADYDGDGRLDLFAGARAGASRLFHNEGGTFVDMSAGSGLVSAGAVRSAEWLDHDGDGRLDLFLVTAQGTKLSTALFRGLEGGFFERAELPLAGGEVVPAASTAPSGTRVVEETEGALGGVRGAPSAPDDARRDGSSSTSGRRTAASVTPSAPIVHGPASGSPLPVPLAPTPSCVISLRDAILVNQCLSASKNPVLGLLYPLSVNLFVAASGNVGIGTTSPTAKLHVAGTARVTSTLTLVPSGDTALDVSTGSIYKGGALFIHTRGGARNTAVGRRALMSTTTGYENTALGDQALYSHTNGWGNTASGTQTLYSNTVGDGNTAIGSRALYYSEMGNLNTTSGYESMFFNTAGHLNVASGFQALVSNTSGDKNTAIGDSALWYNTTGNRNIAVGSYAGSNLTTGSDNIAIGNVGVAAEGATVRIGTAGTHARSFLAGVRGVTTGVADGVAVLIDSAGQLGTVSSSRRFKEDIRDMGDATERLLELRPVCFRYKQEQTLPDGREVPPEYGLIAEEVAEVFPDLVVYDEEGQPFTVKYHVLSSMLLNELKKQAERVAELRGRLEEQDDARGRELAELRERLAALERR